MLRTLSIQNYAIIDSLEIDFSQKLNIITGETGAGKSIILGALGLILGERADTSVLVNKEKKSIVEGVFEVKNKKSIRSFFTENEFDWQEELVVRREINSSGKSRAFINDTPVTLAQLSELSSMLVDLHQQFDTLSIGESDFQREVIDALAGHTAVVDQYRAVYGEWLQVRKDCDELKERKQQFDREADYNQFQYNELEEAGFRENELEEIDAELKLMHHAEGIKTVLDRARFELQESDSPMVQQLKVLVNLLQGYSSYHPDLPALVQRMQSVHIELLDVAGEVESIGSNIQYDPARIEQLNERLSLGYKLQKKHGVNSTAALLEIQEALSQKLQEVLHIDEAIAEKERQSERLFSDAEKLAKSLTAARTKQVKPLEDKVNKLLAQVGMPNARLKVEVKPAEPGWWGADVIEFLFDANKSGQFQPVRKVASGGELSRLMLCIKSLVAEKMDFPTLIFDEIDTGISGEAARQVGIIMKELALRRQVICITHQPQIAGKADLHFFVYKEIVQDAVKTNIRQLSLEERITAIAKMLSGEKPTSAAMENAREMVRN